MKVNWNQVVGIVAGKHTLPDCKVERNVEAIKKARHEFREKKNKQKKNNNKRLDHLQNKGKLAPPTRNERGKRIIDGKPMFWLKRDKKWVEDKNPKASAMVGQTASASQKKGAQAPTNLDYDQRARDVAISNVSHAINLALRNFSESFS